MKVEYQNRLNPPGTTTLLCDRVEVRPDGTVECFLSDIDGKMKGMHQVEPKDHHGRVIITEESFFGTGPRKRCFRDAYHRMHPDAETPWLL